MKLKTYMKIYAFRIRYWWFKVKYRLRYGWHSEEGERRIAEIEKENKAYHERKIIEECEAL